MALEELEFKHGTINEGLIAVASGKGGVGKSTITANLAAALDQAGKEVGIIDADVRGFSIPRILGLQEAPEQIEEKELKPPVVNGIKVMSMGALMPEEEAVIWRAPLLGNTLKQFIEDVHWGELDYLLFDLPPGTGDMPMNVMQLIPGAEMIVTTTPQVTATKVAGRIGQLAQELDSEIVGVIENMSYYECPDCGNKQYIFGSGGGQQLADKLDTNLLAELPLVPKVRVSSDQGKAFVLEEPESLIAEQFTSVAESLL